MWTKSTKGIGIVICNFKKGNIPHAIDLKICDTVVIEQQHEGWYQGYLIDNRAVSGIFPSQYVHVKQPSTRSSDSVTEDEVVVEELNYTLKEWFKALRKLSSSPQQEMLSKSVQSETLKLLAMKKKFTAPFLTKQLKADLRATITSKLDWGNKKLGLDVVPRGVHGIHIKTDEMSPVDVYLIHNSSIFNGAKTIRPTVKGSVTAKQSSCHHMYMQVQCLANLENEEPLEIYYSLYDAKSQSFLSERVMCRVGRGGIMQNFENTECGEFFTAIFVDLTTSDLSLDVYLTAHIYKMSGLRAQEKAKGRFGTAKNVVSYKRPYGCAAVSITNVLQKKHLTRSEDLSLLDKEYAMPLLTVRNNKDDDFFAITDHLIKRVSENKVDELEKLNVVLEVFHGNISTVRQDYPQIFNKKVKVTQKLGFADVVTPEEAAHYVLLENEVRNDFYITIHECEFEKGGKTADKNVEVKAFVLNAQGEEKVCIIQTAGEAPTNHYEAAVFYHSNKPKWREVIKISLPDSVFRECHVRLEFRHCSTQGAEKKLFGFSYLPLEDKKGTAINDRLHSLLVYKPDKKEASEFKKHVRPNYLDLQFETDNSSGPQATSNQFYSVNTRDMCYVYTTLCSTKLTQDVNLLNFLRWKEFAGRGEFSDILANVVHIDNNELVKHHVDFLNSLFQMSCDFNAGTNQNLIFRALVHILHLTRQKAFSQFLPVFEQYIEKTFCATLAHRDLLQQIKLTLERQKDPEDQLLTKVIDILDLLFKFIVRSATQYAGENEGGDHFILSKGMDEFWKALQDVFRYSKNQSRNPDTRISRMAIISRVVDVFPDLMKLLPANKLAKSFSETISMVSKRDSDMAEDKLKCLSKLIKSPLFDNSDSRRIVLELCNAQLVDCFQSQQDLKLAADNVADLLSAIYEHKESMAVEIELVVLNLTRVLSEVIISLDTTDVSRLLMECLITMFSMTDITLFNKLIEQQRVEGNEKMFLRDILKLLTDLITTGSYIPDDWVEMLMVNNSVILLQATPHLSQALASNFIEDSCFDECLWSDFFMMCVKFITQPSLQLEKFSERKETRIREKHQDMRVEMARQLQLMWATLDEFGTNQQAFIPSMIGPFLEVALLPEAELRTTLLEVLNDMLTCNFSEVQGEIIDQLDELYNDGKGDSSFKSAFVKLMTSKLSSDHTDMTHYIDSVSSLIDRLLDYRDVSSSGSENVNTLMLATINLLDFYQNVIKRERLYSQYVYRLKDLNVDERRYTEAGFSLLLNASALSWTDQHQLANDWCDAEKEWERKERHYNEVIKFFDQGQTWEDAVPLCKELANFYESKLFDYVQLANTLNKQAELVKKVLVPNRCVAKYYRVAFFGNSFPYCMRNKSFVYKGDAFSNPSSVIDMLKTEYPNAEQLNESIEPPNLAELNPNKQYFQIVIIEPLSDTEEIFPDSLKVVDYKISSFYKWNRVQRFTYDKPYHYPKKDKENEHRSLHTKRYLMWTKLPMPGISAWCELQETKTKTITPIEVALEGVKKKNSDIKNVTQKYRDDRTLDQGDLSRVLQGSADAKVSGGIIIYQKTFLCDDSANDAQTEELRQLILEHLRVVRDGLHLFREIVTTDLRPLCKLLFEEYNKLQDLIKKQDPRMELISLKSMESASALSVFDMRSSESNRASSDYSSSDIESHKECSTPKRKSASVNYPPSYVSSRFRDVLRSSEETSPNPLRKQDGQLLDVAPCRNERGNSTFYAEIPIVDIHETEEDNDNAPPPLPVKFNRNRASSVPHIDNKTRQEVLKLTKGDHLQPSTFNPANRPLPEAPTTNPEKRPSIVRHKTVCIDSRNTESEFVEYKLPKSTQRPPIDIKNRPVPEPPSGQGIEDSMPPPKASDQQKSPRLPPKPKVSQMNNNNDLPSVTSPDGNMLSHRPLPDLPDYSPPLPVPRKAPPPVPRKTSPTPTQLKSFDYEELSSAPPTRTLNGKSISDEEPPPLPVKSPLLKSKSKGQF